MSKTKHSPRNFVQNFYRVQNALFENPKFAIKDVQPRFNGGDPRSVSFAVRCMVYSILCMHAYGKKGVCCPGQDRIAKLAHIDRRVVIRAIADLRILGLIEVQARYNSTGKRTSNGYYLPDLEAIEMWIEEDEDDF